MIREVSKLSEHFRCIALSELPLDRAADTQFQALARFGPVSTKQLTSWHDVFSWLQPLRTFPRHFIVAEIGNWSLVMCDMIGEHCLVDILFHSRLFGCRAVGGIALPFERRFFYIEKGEHVRDVECFREGKWFFRERGTPLSLEDPECYLRRRKAERLPENLVLNYISTLTSISFPLRFETITPRVTAFERSWHQLQVTPKELNVANDLEMRDSVA